jgi:hypothetical protein
MINPGSAERGEIIENGLNKKIKLLENKRLFGS